MMRPHIGAVAHAEQERARRTILEFMHLAGRMYNEAAGRHRHGLLRGAHGPAAGEAKIDFGRLGVAVIRAYLARLPAGDRDVALGNLAQDFFNVVTRIPLLFALEVVYMHGGGVSRALRLGLT